jgi:hypothetical protein
MKGWCMQVIICLLLQKSKKPNVGHMEERRGHVSLCHTCLALPYVSRFAIRVSLCHTCLALPYVSRFAIRVSLVQFVLFVLVILNLPDYTIYKCINTMRKLLHIFKNTRQLSWYWHTRYPFRSPELPSCFQGPCFFRIYKQIWCIIGPLAKVVVLTCQSTLSMFVQ